MKKLGLFLISVLFALPLQEAMAFKVGGMNWVNSDGQPNQCIKTDGAGNLGWLDVRTRFSATAPLAFDSSTGIFSIPVATSSANGYLSSANWTTFNAKQAAGNYITALTSDVTASGPGSAAATVAAVGGSTAANVHSAELAANGATAVNTPSTILKRDGSGQVAATTFTGALAGNATTSTSFTGALAGDVTGNQGTTAVASVGTSTAANVHAAELAANAATAVNTASTILKRDGSGQVAATTFTGNLTGTVTGHSSLDLPTAGGTMTGPILGVLGSASAPSFSFSGDATNGFYDIGSNVFGIALNGAELGRFTGGQLNLTSGTDLSTAGLLRVANTWTTATGSNSQTAVRGVVNNTFDGAMTAQLTGGNFTTTRQITNSQTDTQASVALAAGLNYTVPTSKTLTGGGTNIGLLVSPISNPSGTLALGSVQKIGITADATPTGTRKTGVYVGTQSGATNNAAVADNTTYTGSWFLNQTDTAPSLLGGYVDVQAALLFDPNGTALPASATFDGYVALQRTNGSGSGDYAQAGSLVIRPRVSSTAGRSSVLFYTGSPSVKNGSVNEVGLWTLGVSGGTQTHVVNGGLAVSGNSSFSGGIDNTVIGGTTRASGNFTAVQATATIPQLKLTADTTSHSPGIWLMNAATSGHYNWLLGAQYNVSDGIELTPSTAVDGSTFSVPAFSVNQTGTMTIKNSGAASVSMQAGTASGAGSIRMNNAAASGHYNWNIGAQFNHSESLGFAPSTATDGGTFSSDVMWLTQSGQMILPTNGHLSVGTTSTAITYTKEAASLLDNQTTDVSHAAVYADSRQALDGAITTQNAAVHGINRRTITTSQTDTNIHGAVLGATTFTVPTSQTLTTAGIAYSNFYSVAPTLSGGGALALNGFAHFQVAADSTATGTAKYGLFVGAQSGATNNYGVYVSGANPSVFNGGILGSQTNDSAASGNVGETVSSIIASGSAVALTTATAANLTSIALTAGDWDVTALVCFTGTPTGTAYQGGINTTSATLPATTSGALTSTPTSPSVAADNCLSIPVTRQSLSGATTIYAPVKATFSVGSVSAYGRLSARRMR